MQILELIFTVQCTLSTVLAKSTLFGWNYAKNY